jgi:hypothetical protein
MPGTRLQSGTDRLPFGSVTLNPDNDLPVTLALSADPSHDASVGGWATSVRFGRSPSTWWQGPQDAATLELQVAIDSRIAPDRSVQRERPAYVREVLAALYRMGRPAAGKGEPPTIAVDCPSLPMTSGKLWLLQRMPTGSQLVFNGVLVRQEIALSLIEYVELPAVQRTSAKATRDTKNQRRTRTIQSRPGDTIRTIAVRQLGDAGRWKDIRTWNKSLAKQDPDERLRVGTIVVLK